MRVLTVRIYPSRLILYTHPADFHGRIELNTLMHINTASTLRYGYSSGTSDRLPTLIEITVPTITNLSYSTTGFEDEVCFQRKGKADTSTTRKLDPRVAVSGPDTQRPTTFGTFNFWPDARVCGLD